MKDLVDTKFFRIGSITYDEDPESLRFSNVATFDATIYADNMPKYSMIRESTSIRPHLVRNINLLDSDKKTWLQNFWDQANNYANTLGTPYQCFLVISGNRHSVAPHSHGDHLGDTVTVVSVQGTSTVDTKLFIDNHTELLYPTTDNNFYAVCFDGNVTHSTQSQDDNVYFHFVYDLINRIDAPKNIWVQL